jgi:hypothetical protein
MLIPLRVPRTDEFPDGVAQGWGQAMGILLLSQRRRQVQA